MSGPTVFAEVIQFAAAQAQSKQDANASIGEQSYTILLILTDGAVSDMEQTKAAIRNASSAPLSIVIVGIGNADFSAMQFLDDFQQQEGGRTRDIVQFVEFNKYKHDKQALTRETLDEIPDQLVGYFVKKNIMPLSPTSSSKLNIVEDEYNSEEDIDLAMSTNSLGEIQLSNPDQAKWDAQSYGTAAKYFPPAMLPPEQSTQAVYSSASSVTYPPSGGSCAPVANNVHATTVGSSYGHLNQPSTGGSYLPQGQSLYGGSYVQQGQTSYGGSYVPHGLSSYVSSPYGNSYSPTPTTGGGSNLVDIQAPINSYPGMKVQVKNPKTGQFQIVTIPTGVAPGSMFAVQL